MQWDYGDGPTVAGRWTVLLCALLAWSRYRVVRPLDGVGRDGAGPHVARVRWRADLRADRQRDGVGRSCVRDRGAKPDDRGRRTPLRPDDRERASRQIPRARAARRRRSGSRRPTSCRPITTCATTTRASPRSRRRASSSASASTRVRPDHPARAAVMVADERDRLHRLPAIAHTVRSGETRQVSTISVGGALYSVPSTLVDKRVCARIDGCELVVVHADSADGPREVARQALTTPGRPSIDDAHYPPRRAGALERKPRAASADGRRSWRSVWVPRRG
jgi:hypothetical protein